MNGNNGNMPLPQRTSDVFPAHLVPCFKYEKLNKVQQRVLRAAFVERENLMVSAPTGSGKTAILEAASLQVFERSRGSPATKVLYIAPVKALLRERLNDWRTRFGESSIGMKFVELSGDARDIEEDEVDAAHVLLCTPEKWDAITRSGSAKARLVGAVELLLVDEIHHIGDVSRGATLEAIILRMMNLSRREREDFSWQPIRDLRIIGLSATFSNACDIASWIGCSSSGLAQFGNEFRPVPLTCQVFGCGEASNDFVFERNLDSRVLEIVRQFSNGKPTLVFCNSRVAATRLANQLAAEIRHDETLNVTKRERMGLLNQHTNKKYGQVIVEFLESGVGYHHAGMTDFERATVEELFRANKLLILCCTSSLAVGVNLPAHLAIIKSTRLYQGRVGYVNYSESQVLQMIGRAGRSGFDSSGVAVILTETRNVARYRTLTNETGTVRIKSQLLQNLHDVLNTEIALGTVKEEKAAQKWLQGTFFAKSTRGIGEGDGDAIQVALRTLSQSGMIQRRKSGLIETTVAGSIMSHSYIDFQTMIELVQVAEGRINFRSLLAVLAKCTGVRIPLRRQEKSALNQINETSTKFRVTNPDGTLSINSDEAKTNVLIQAVLSRRELGDSHLKQEAEQAINEATRVLAALSEYLQRKDDGESLCTVLRLRRCLILRSWDDSVGSFSLQQLPTIDSSTAAALEYIGIRSIRKLAQANPDKIDAFLLRQPPIGQQLVSTAQAQPQFEILTSWNQKTRGPLKTLQISVTAKDENAGQATLIVWSETKLLHFQQHILRFCACNVHVCEEYQGKIHIRLLQDTTVGLDSKLEIDLGFSPTEESPICKRICGAEGNEKLSHVQPTKIRTPGSIMSSIMRLKAHHAKVKQQKMLGFVVKKTRRLESETSDLRWGAAGTSLSNTSISVSVTRSPVKQAKRRKCATTNDLAESIGRSKTENQTSKPSVHFQDRAVTTTNYLFDKFRFKQASAGNSKLGNEGNKVTGSASCDLKQGNDSKAAASRLKKDTISQADKDRVSDKLLTVHSRDRFSTTCQKAIEAHPDRSLEASDCGKVHPFLQTYLATKEQENPGSLLETARSSIEYSFLKRFMEQPKIPDDLSQERKDEDVFELAVAIPATTIAPVDYEHSFHSVFF